MPGGQPLLAAVLGGQHPRPVRGDRDRVLEVSGPASVGGDDRPGSGRLRLRVKPDVQLPFEQPSDRRRYALSLLTREPST